VFDRVILAGGRSCWGWLTVPELDFVYGVVPLLVLAAYLWLQVRALRRFRRGWRRAALVPVAAMSVAAAISIGGGLAGADLAPLWIFLTLPAAVLFLLVLFAVKGVREMRRWGVIRG